MAVHSLDWCLPETHTLSHSLACSLALGLALALSEIPKFLLQCTTVQIIISVSTVNHIFRLKSVYEDVFVAIFKI